MHHGDHIYQGPRPYKNELGKYQLRMEIQFFSGSIEEVLDWLIDVERFFDIMKIPDRHKVKLVSIRFKATAFVWWEQTITV